MAQTTLNPYNNKNLFSNYYLNNKVKSSSEWRKDNHIAAFSEIKKLYDEEKKSFETFNEAQLIKHFLDPIFKILLFEPETEEAAGSEFPDYAFFKDKVSRIEAHKNKGTISFYTNAIAIGEVKKWDIELDGKPILQLRNYLDVTRIKWGILTNGRKWRLFCKEKGRDDYYEVDLPSLLDSNNLEEFKYFFYFFRRDAFLGLPEVFLEQVLRGSEDHAKAIGNNLKDNVYKAMKKIADGFFGRPQNNLDRNNETARELVQKNTMLFLYRLLFLLYAEDRNLLDLKNSKYMANHSFYRIKKEVEEKRGRSEQGYDNTGTFIWDGLKNLFDLINLGSEAFGEKEFHVPAYNGGLFDAIKNPELEIWKIGDKYLAEAIHLLTWSDINGSGFVDYSDMEIRHLGSIYEGLLEYKLKVAESDIVTKGNEWVILEKYNEEKKQKKAFEDFDEFSHARNGELYLATDKGERKSTGSYYTPDYIVNYIVRNTVGPVVEEKWKEAEGNKLSLIDATLSVKVLDPAMGSGHFLVGAVEFLADMLLDAAQKDIDAGRLSDEPRFYDKGWARREVVSHCIYGVDLNPMAVELAKVGLWLTTISKDKPLSFLDHRLKQGNSLIGARLIDLPWYPDLKVKKEKKDETVLKKFEEEVHRPFVDKIVHQLKQLSEIDDDTIEHVRQKKELFEKLKENKQYLQIKSIADVYTAVYFGNETTEVNKNPKFAYNDLFWALKGDDKEWSRKTYKPWFKTAMDIARDKSFFHWELEFPELFFEGGAPKENPGWDAVVGNPPYVSNWELTSHDSELPTKLERFYTEVVSGHWDLYVLFSYRAISLTNSKGFHSFIVPSSFATEKYGVKLREHLLTKCKIVQLVDFGQHLVFEDVARQYLIYIVGTTFLKDNISKIIKYGAGKFEQALLIPQNQFLEFSNYSLRVDLKDSDIALKSKLEHIHEKLGSLCCVNVGVVAHSKASSPIPFKKDDVISLQDGLGKKKYLEGSDIHRYEKNWNGLFIDYDGKREFFHRPKFPELFDSPKIMVRRVSGANNAMLSCYDKEKYYTNDNVIQVVLWTPRIQELQPPDNYEISEQASNYDLRFIASILNSRLNSYYFASFLATDTLQSSYTGVYPEDLRKLPIRRISFTTPPDRRAALVEQAKALYSAEAPDSGDPGFKCGDFVSARLSAAPEESDVVHDLLAHLAERMIEMNKVKNAEIKSFIDFLKGEIGAPIEDFSSKTAIQEYYIHEFQNLIDVLVKNKKKLKAGYDPKSPSNYKHLQQWYNDSTGRLKPLMGKIKATDGLIDQIVYKLYGLTEDEIKIVEGSISGEKNAEGLKT